MGKRKASSIVLLLAIVCTLIAPIKNSSAQTYADKSFYLVDSLVKEELSSADKALIDKALKQYHKSTEDSTKLTCLERIVDECWDDKVWPKYNQLMYSTASAATNKSDRYNRIYLKHQASALNNWGYSAQLSGNSAKALDFMQRSIGIDKELGNQKEVAVSQNNIGFIYKAQGDIKKALEYYHSSLSIQKSIGDTITIATLLNNIGHVYFSQNDIKNSLLYFNNSMELRKEIGNDRGLAGSLNNMASTYEKEIELKRGTMALYSSEEVNKLLPLYEQSYAIRQRLNDRLGEANSCNNLAGIFLHQGDSLTGFEYLKKSLAIRESIDDKAGIVMSLINIGRALWDRDEEEALIEVKKALKLAYEIGDPERISLSSKVLYDIYKKRGDFEKALRYHEVYVSMKDSILNNKNQKEIIRSQLLLESKKSIRIPAGKISGSNLHQNEGKSLVSMTMLLLFFIGILLAVVKLIK